jgi:N-acetyl-alpha-D-muramate 1-phosphate uridylyltransferase
MNLPVVVLAGGLATRLYPVTETIPKSLISINGTPFVLHQLSLFRRNNVNQIHFCLGHLGDIVKDAIEKSGFMNKMQITYSFDGDTLLGTAGAIRKSLSFLPETFFVTYGDSYLDVNYSIIESHFANSSSDNNGLMTVYRNSNKYDTSNVIFQDKKILLYSKNQSVENMKYIDFGLSILRKNHFSSCQVDTPLDLSVILENLSRNGQLTGYEIFERFYEIGSVKGIEDLSNYLNSKKI